MEIPNDPKKEDASSYENKRLLCKDCGNDFIWTAKEQAFYYRMKFKEPKTCPNCRTKRAVEDHKTSKNIATLED